MEKKALDPQNGCMKYHADENIPLLEALSRLSPKSSKNTLRSWIKEGRVRIEGKRASNSSTEISSGQTVTIGSRKVFLPHGIEILFEDADLAVIEKPAGLLSVASAFDKSRTAHAILKSHFRPKKVFVVHRLDQDTSGVMLFALSQEAYERLKKDFEQHAIERSYTAIVEGKPDKQEGMWKSYLHEDPNYVVHIADSPEKGREAITSFKVKAVNKRCSLLELTLHTGRKNQIRVHCRHAGHPIAGDKKYGALSNPAKRLCLHAHHLGFRHPITYKMMRFNSPLPEEFNKIFPQ